MLSPKPADYCHVDLDQKPQLVVSIDTEEEFDWSREFSRSNTSVRSMRFIDRIQTVFDEYSITPVYLVDYPVAYQSDGYRPLQEIHASGRCIIGAHLHPWVNPPFEEPVTRYNSFPGNLPRVLEEEKLRTLGDLIGERFGVRPTIYKAGRYGVGLQTQKVLEEQGYEVDLSVCPHMDYSHEGGPNFTHLSVRPYWFGERRRLLELPLTVGFTGLLRRWGEALHSFASCSFLSQLYAPGILARSGLVNKIWLSPEGYTLVENIQLVRTLYDDGVRIFSFAFHSPSVEAGNTPYVTSPAEVEKFVSHCRRFFDYFMGELGGVPTTTLALRAQLHPPVQRENLEG
jgi:hypothetical protein